MAIQFYIQQNFVAYQKSLFTFDMVCTFPRRYSTQILKDLVLDSRVLEPILLKPEFHLALLNSLTLGSHGDIPLSGAMFPHPFETLGMFYKLLEQLLQCIQTVLIIC